MKKTLLFILLWFIPSIAVASDPIVVAADYSREFPPFFWRDKCTGKTHGFPKELQYRLWDDLGITIERYQVSFSHQNSIKELITLLNDGTVDVALALPKVIDEAIVSYPNAPYLNLPYAVFYKNNQDWTFSRWEDLKNHTGVWATPYHKDPRNKAFKHFSDEQLQLSFSRDRKQALMRLIRGEIDYVITFQSTGKTVLKSLESGHNIHYATISNITTPVYMVIANSSPLAGRIDEIDALMSHYNDSGYISSLMNASIKKWLRTQKQINCH